MAKRYIFYLCFVIVSFSYPANSFAPGYSIKNKFEAKSSSTDEISVAVKTQAFETHLHTLFTQTGLDKANLDFVLFRKALVGYYNIQSKPGSFIKPILSIVDFTKSSRQKRLWVIDLKNHKLLFNTWVAHGKGTGDEFARAFSNEPNSFKSSLGFYLTAQTYLGKHGLSLKLNGLDQNYNTNALARAVVIHGADYVSANFIQRYGRLGRSLGCPALPLKETKPIINKIKNNTCLYIYGSDKTYSSPYLTEASAIDSFAAQFFSLSAS
ncbi:murein L,D-transpeptidase catalytic domain family protein [Adhaeribacter radiodurans]|uniref:Murein L,D-transpeptidase catalytic domain family protein n=1 Tax=Adhaeribacter radiodurans TaxID=2745197 RepID=A0A7L7L778_9BACT|nr:murein L,D-transpeptidase catalytic domain family protein [Adhaeribacter radiodurans]QMU28385.1 murein L,D-transpeptidase catalytic domain family protein [Adhaeribacter radiodurans]